MISFCVALLVVVIALACVFRETSAALLRVGRDMGVASLRLGAGILSARVLKRAHWHTIRGFDLWDYSNRLDDFASGKPWRPADRRAE